LARRRPSIGELPQEFAVEKPVAVLATLAVWLAAGSAGAQTPEPHHGGEAIGMVMPGMEPHRHAGPHLVTPPPRAVTAADSARALALLATIRASASRYRDSAAAIADGFRPFLPNVKSQRIWHYTKRWNALSERFRFDPAKPTSLLYRRAEGGTLELVGVMYAMPRSATIDELDARVPTSIAAWHRHVNLCLPPGGHPERRRETANGALRFGPDGAITTAADCAAANGRFVPALFGWMVHVNAFATDGLRAFGGP
jgi:hypothetical protein